MAMFYIFEVKYCQLTINEEVFNMEFLRNNKQTIILVITITFILWTVAGMVLPLFM